MSYLLCFNVLDTFIDVFVLYLFFTKKVVFSSEVKNKISFDQLQNWLDEEIEKNNDLIAENRRLETEKYKLVQELNKHS